MRQKKLARHLSASSAAEQRIAQLTSQRSALFEALENVLQAQQLPRHEDRRSSSKGTPLAISCSTPTQPRRVKDHDTVDLQSFSTEDSSLEQHINDTLIDAVEAEHKPSGTDHLLITKRAEPNHTPPKSDLGLALHDEQEPNLSSTGTDGNKVEGLRKLRASAAETDASLQSERIYLQSLRLSHASNLARIERLEEDLCRHSENWETEEKERLSIEAVSAASGPFRKRKRQDGDVLESGSDRYAKKTIVKAVETFAILGLGAGMIFVKQAMT